MSYALTRVRWLVLFSLGCGRIAFDPLNDAAPIDAPRVCWDRWFAGVPPLTTPMRVLELDTAANEHDVALTADGRQLYFSSNRTGTIGGDDIYVALRDEPFGPFTQVEHVPSINTGDNEGPFFTRDGLTGVLSSDRTTTEGGSDLWIAQRSALDQPFTVTSTGLAILNTTSADYDAWLSVDELRLYYVSNAVILLTTRTAVGAPWSAPVPVPGVNTVAEYDVSLSPDERVIVFTSHRLSPMRDIFVAVRATTADGFQTPMPIDAVNTTFTDYDAHITTDGCELYWASSLETPGSLAIFVARVVD